MSQSPHRAAVQEAARQQQFLEVVDRDEAERRFRSHLRLLPLDSEVVALSAALDRVLARDVVADVDVTTFDRSNVDGFALQAADTYGALEEQPTRLKLNGEIIHPGVEPQQEVQRGTATTIATGGMVPRGADAVVMVEDTDVAETDEGTFLEIRRAVSPGASISFAGTDIARGETVLRRGRLISSREIGVLSAIGRAEVEVYRRPQVAIISTGNEIVSPPQPLPPASVYDSNAAILASAVKELGGEPLLLGTVVDNEEELDRAVRRGLSADVLLLSGGTSKGAGDLSYRVVSRLPNPGIVAHGVALKPGKPICLAVTDGKPVVVLPGFPTSAIFTFHEFVAPVIRALGGRPPEQRETRSATLPMRVNSQRGRREYLLVSLFRSAEGLAAYPMGKGSGSVTTFSYADGFITIDQHTEIVEAGSRVEVQLLSRNLEPADLVVIGSHCVGLDLLLGELEQRGFTTKALHVGSTGGLNAAGRGECDLAGIHLMDAETGEYNRPFLESGLELLSGYRRMQGIVYRPGDVRFEGRSAEEALAEVRNDPQCTMVNRNAGSGTRILIDQLLNGHQPPGYPVQAKSHNAVAAAVSQKRADWGLAIETVARQYGLGFLPVAVEHYDFVVPQGRLHRPEVEAFREVLDDPEVREQLRQMGFRA